MKRNREDTSSGEEDFGPVPQGMTTAEGDKRPAKKVFESENESHSCAETQVRRAQFRKLFLSSLPDSRLYEKSYMHRDFVVLVQISRKQASSSSH